MVNKTSSRFSCDVCRKIFSEKSRVDTHGQRTKLVELKTAFRNTGFGIFIPPKNIELLVKSVDYLLDYHSKYNAEKMARYAREKFGYEAVGRRLTEIYRSVAK